MLDELRSRVAGILVDEEDVRLKVYDDATGKPIGPGTLVIGHPTIGIGRCLDRKGITRAEADMLLGNDMAEVFAGVPPLVQGWAGLSLNRRAVLLCMGYQMGLEGLAKFKATLAAIGRGDFATASSQMLASLWARQTPKRAQRMAKLMRDG